MNKDEKIEYLNKIKPFINLKAICEDYNKKNPLNIDYNNLRAVLNGVSKTRLSEEKLASFINYLYSDLYKNTFQTDSIDLEEKELALKSILNYYTTRLEEKILKEFEDGIHHK